MLQIKDKKAGMSCSWARMPGSDVPFFLSERKIDLQMGRRMAAVRENNTGRAADVRPPGISLAVRCSGGRK